MKIYTKKGDTGETGLLGGGRVSKVDPVLALLGDLDETNACLGLAAVQAKGSECAELLPRIQSALLDLGAELASHEPRFRASGLEGLTQALEDWIDAHDSRMPELRNFVLPGGTILAAHLHLARTVCRRAERSLVAVSLERPVRAEALAFTNRLSDWLFCAARFANHESRVEDSTWTGMR